MENYYLVHHGILGMKWGVRRYQNPDGTLTAEGRRRYRLDSSGKYVKRSRAERKAYDRQVKLAKQAAAAKKIRSPRDKKITEMTDKQLEKYVNRMATEKRALELRADINRLDPKPVSAGQQFVRAFLKESVTPAALNVGKQYIEKLMKQALAMDAKKAETAEQRASRLNKYWDDLNKTESSKASYNQTKALNDEYEKTKDISVYQRNKKNKDNNNK